ncbi:MAG: hypothetical protein NVSMB52_11050 [Chloroflexota bacterium]
MGGWHGQTKRQGSGLITAILVEIMRGLPDSSLIGGLCGQFPRHCYPLIIPPDKYVAISLIAP